ncbi:MAG TPA: ROK family protein [Myxococcota bacterium]|nr:ROK family protein [Myxococcota bacterium]
MIPWARGGQAIPSYLGIDVGGTKLALAVGDADGHVRARRRRATEPCGRPEADLERIVADARALLAEVGLAPHEIAAIGVSLPGPLDPVAGVIHNPPNLPGWKEVDVRGPLARAFGRPVHLENDANAAALAEWRFGAGRGFRHLVYLTMSTGVGGGLVLDGRLYRGAGCQAGEFGHAPVEWEGELCPCGQRGCLEAYVGGAAWMRRLRRVTPPGSRVAGLAGGVEHALPEHAVAAAREGDAFALGEIERWVEFLARGIVQIVFGLAPEVVVLGTIPTAMGEELCFAPLRRKVARHAWPLLTEHLAIVPAALGEDLPYLAGLAAAFEAQP